MITKDNYFSVDNKGLSQSKIKDYLLCPNYCYRKNISGELKKEQKKSFDVGAAVDDIITQRTELNNFAICELDGRTKAGKEERADLEYQGKTILSRADYDLIVEMADAIMKTSAYKTLIADGFVFQEILQIPTELGEHFDCLYGMPDAYKIRENGICDLIDLKTAATVADKQYRYKFLDFGYDKQLWFYAMLLQKKYPEITGFRFWHLAVEKKEPFAVKLISIPPFVVYDNSDLMMETIDKIRADREFKKADASFESPTKLDWGGENDWGDDED